MRDKRILFLILLSLLFLFSACSAAGKEKKTTPAATLPDSFWTRAADPSTSESSPIPDSAEEGTSSPGFSSLTLSVFAGGPPYPGEDLSYIIKIEQDGTDYIGSLSKYGNMRARRLKDEELLRIEQLLEEEKVTDWNGFDIHETGLYDGYSISFSLIYRDGSRISGRGYGHSPNNYFQVAAELEKILSAEDVYSDIILSLENGPVLPAGTEVLKLKINNHTYETVGFGRSFRLYRKQDDTWTPLPWKDGATVTADWIELMGYSAESFSVDIPYLFGSVLPAGEYRIEWTVSAGGRETKIAAEFLVLQKP
ncbi:MAG: hypothetical protein J5855_10615 [Mailhella sp.]|nr:hypothetical protein [Mailhella sp.]